MDIEGDVRWMCAKYGEMYVCMYVRINVVTLDDSNQNDIYSYLLQTDHHQPHISFHLSVQKRMRRVSDADGACAC